MAAIYLREDDVRELLDVETAIEAVEAAFRGLAEEKSVNIPRSRARAPGITLHVMSAAAEYLGFVGWKVYTTTRAKARFHVGLSSVESGELVALIEADFLGQLRTGAASGVATEYMARPDARTVGVFGTGKQARTQLKAMTAVRRIERAEVYSRNDERRQRFAHEQREIIFSLRPRQVVTQDVDFGGLHLAFRRPQIQFAAAARVERRLVERVRFLHGRQSLFCQFKLGLGLAQREILRRNFRDERNLRAAFGFGGGEIFFQRLPVQTAHAAEKIHFIRCRADAGAPRIRSDARRVQAREAAAAVHGRK